MRLQSIAAGSLLSALALGIAPACVLDWGSQIDFTHESCGAGLRCDLDCGDAPCIADCGSNASCDVGCDNGGCEVDCSATSECHVACRGGGCKLNCGTATKCTMACAGGGCTQECGSSQLSCTCDGCS